MSVYMQLFSTIPQVVHGGPCDARHDDHVSVSKTEYHDADDMPLQLSHHFDESTID